MIQFIRIINIYDRVNQLVLDQSPSIWFYHRADLICNFFNLSFIKKELTFTDSINFKKNGFPTYIRALRKNLQNNLKSLTIY